MSGSTNRKWVWIGGIAVAVALLILPFLFKNYRVFQFNLVLVYAVAILGLNILTGFNGQFSLGHGAFYAFGAYTAAILMSLYQVPYWATLPAAFVVCFVFGLLIGFPALRLAGHFLALATFALALAVPQLLKYKNIEHWTGGVQGIVLSKPEPPFEFTLFDQPLSADRWLYYFTLFVAALMFLFAWNLLRGRVGRALVAIRDHPIAATAMGINLAVFKSLTFGTSAGFTGVAGALGAIVVAFVSPDSFTITLAILLEEIGLAPRGRAGAWAGDGHFDRDGAMPLNLHGGLLSHGHCGVAGAMAHLAEVHLQMTGRAGARQAPRAGVALLHGDGGVLSSHVSLVVESPPE